MKPDLQEQEPYIVAIGASAGGLEAIHDFFDNMPVNGNLSFVIIQHLSPDYKSLLVELISKHTNMQVFEAQHNVLAQKHCVYVIPNNKLITIDGGRLQLSNKNFDKAPNTAIDTFLKSLAIDRKEKAIAVILSGTGTDGTKGAHAVHENNGLVIVQDPISAKFDGMPNSAIAAGFADLILTPELIPEEIFNYTKEQPVRLSANGRPDERSLPEVLRLIENHCGHDFHNYKTPTILRRISKRMGQLGFKNFQDYLNTLRTAPDECKILGKEFLIGVTKFFRDRAAFDIINNEVLPNIVKAKSDNDVLKIWVTACSTGQEAYSMAILVNEYLAGSIKNLDVKIFATDIDADSIEFAAKATYSKAVLEDMDSYLIKKYFTEQNGQYTIVPSIRKQVVFAKHNILKDPPFIKNDMVTCRNMLIYMNPLLQRKVFTTLEFSLSAGGFLFLGPSEIPSSIKNNLNEVDGKWKIFRKIKEVNPFQGERSATDYTINNDKSTKQHHIAKEELKNKDLALDFQEILIEQLGFAALSIDDNYEIKEAIGNFRNFLSLPEKIASLNILKMVGMDLSVALNTAIRKAKKEGKKITLPNVRIRDNDTDKYLNISVKPATKDGLTTIVIGECHGILPNKPITDFNIHDSESISYITELEDELKGVKLNLQIAVESLETTNEELQSSNEELLSANEELQSSNEELQSLNEELHTLNTEHQLRIRELIELNDDLNNYFRSTEIGQIFVDKDLRIRKFNPAAIRLVNLIETDIGRPIDHISTNLRSFNLIENIMHVVANKMIIEKEVLLSNGKTSIVRVLPYLRQNGQIDGTVISFYDISNIKELNNIIKGVFNSSTSSIMAFKSIRNDQSEIVDFEFMAANHATDQLLNKENESYIGKSAKKTNSLLFANGLFEKCVRVVNGGKPLHTELPANFSNKEEWFEVVANKMEDGLVLTMTNITDKKEAEQKLRKNYQELIKVKENLKQVNTNLEEKIAERTHNLTISEERFRLIAGATNDAVWDRDIVNNKIWWNESFYKLFGYEAKDITNETSFWLDKIHPDDKKRVEKSIHDVINSGLRQWTASYRFLKADGVYAHINDKGAVINDEFGIPYRMVGAMSDVSLVEHTELRLKEKNIELEKVIQEFKFVTDFMPQMVWSTQPDGYHDFYNKGWYDYTGLDFEATKDKGWDLVLHPNDAERTWKVWRHSLQTGDFYEIEYRMRRYDGQYRWFLARAIPLKDPEGKIVKWFGTCTDIHDQKMISDILEQKVEERTTELRKINAALEVTNAELFQFASVASHDLKEPLRKIHMFSTLIKDRYLNEESNGAADYMNRIISSSARMTKLINDLLAFSRLSIQSLFEKTDLNQVVQEVLSDLELVITEKDACVEVQTLPVIDAVPGQLRQVFQNIISNALKFTSEGKTPHIVIRSQIISAEETGLEDGMEGEYCKIILSDNGIGFDEQHATKIFTIFQRLHGREKYEGTGIGLAITKKIIDKHNGLIYANSTHNEGSVFTIILPVKQNMERIKETSIG